MTRTEVEARYLAMFGAVPETIRDRLVVLEAAERLPALAALEAYRTMFIDGNALGETPQRLVHFGMTLANAGDDVVEMHARAALRSGAPLAHLVGVCETAAVVLGMPAYTRGMRALAAFLADPQ